MSSRPMRWSRTPGMSGIPETITTHGGYITKGDNNNFSDQGYLTIPERDG